MVGANVAIDAPHVDLGLVKLGGSVTKRVTFRNFAEVHKSLDPHFNF